jgi:hypothetical protein
MQTYAGLEPSLMSAPTIEINSSILTKVKVTWTSPLNNGGMSIIAYKVMIRATTGIFYEAAECDGSDATVRDNSTCDVSLATLITSPFLLV